VVELEAGAGIDFTIDGHNRLTSAVDEDGSGAFDLAHRVRKDGAPAPLVGRACVQPLGGVGDGRLGRWSGRVHESTSLAGARKAERTRKELDRNGS
jgi:hypothetical protein